MPKHVPPAGTPAREAFDYQGIPLKPDKPVAYPGVDQWKHPRKDIPAGTRLVQLDYRDEKTIRSSGVPATEFFTDERTLEKAATRA